jgi:predicted nucleic acid-binding Zn ribbon protein
VDRLVSAPAIQFKGSGWYVTDYGKGSSQGSTVKDGGSSESGKSDSKSDGKSEGKSESKTEGKSDSKTPASSGEKKKSAAKSK